ncbi:hypothetical protein V502_08514 [Pseudogymnoascus sp. VKM F-4520 (FW-2644)]|nr:hypothetical protein V502_08514 [Pseudogymnoascus sp. VKM F-4520 (FW-2644)]
MAEGAPNTTAGSFFDASIRVQPDAIFALTAEYNADLTASKVNLGQGTYRDEHGQPWVLPSVREARKRLEQQGLTHEYLPILGLPEFRRVVAETVLGPKIYLIKNSQIASCQSLSGTGALHLAGRLLERCRSSRPKVYLPEPTWSNHMQVFSSLGFDCQKFRYYDPESREIDMESYLTVLSAAEPGSVVVLHACAHNPTGCDPTDQQWEKIGRIMKEKDLFPLFDAAYLGFNSGSLDRDAFAIRHFINTLGMEAAVCVSFAKSMGLYGERVGCVFFVASTVEIALNCTSVLEQSQRSEISNPPAYGARIVNMVLNDINLRSMWYDDLVSMNSRIRSMRLALYDNLISQEKYHIYMAEDSRISVAGLNKANVVYVAAAISSSSSSSSIVIVIMESSSGVGSSKLRLGWIGLGSMGLGMATNLQKHLRQSGAPNLQYYNRTMDRGIPLQACGSTPASSITDLTNNSDVVFLSLSNDAALNSTIEAIVGHLEEADHHLAGKIIVDTSTVHPNTSSAAEARFAAQRRNVYCGPAIKPFIVGVMGRVLIQLGEDVKESVMLKTVGNFMTAGMMELVAEAHVFAEKPGLGSKALESLISERYGPLALSMSKRLTTGAYMPAKGEQPWSDLKLALKDVGHGIDCGEEAGSRLWVAELALKNLTEASQFADAQERSLDSSSMYGILRQQAGLPFETDLVKRRDAKE